MGNANAGKKGDQVENGKQRKELYRQMVTLSHENSRYVQTVI